jgi:hypothetical protein
MHGVHVAQLSDRLYSQPGWVKVQIGCAEIEQEKAMNSEPLTIHRFIACLSIAIAMLPILRRLAVYSVSP